MNRQQLMIVAAATFVLAAVAIMTWQIWPARTAGAGNYAMVHDPETGERAKVEWKVIFRDGNIDPVAARWRYKLSNGRWGFVLKEGETEYAPTKPATMPD